ncbi:MAG TPA: hypothetical protein VFW07_01515 [Parafilimonas sp.]|nr:hypothetical protein [Parafilimonas sp.]
MAIQVSFLNQLTRNQPTLYISDFIEKNRQHYYDNLFAVSTKNEMVQWLKFFLVGIVETANKAIETLNNVLKLRNELENKSIIRLGKRISKAKALLQYLYSKPVITVADVTNKLEITKQTAHALIQDFEKLGILKEQTGYKRNRIFVFENYLNLFK